MTQILNLPTIDIIILVLTVAFIVLSYLNGFGREWRHLLITVVAVIFSIQLYPLVLQFVAKKGPFLPKNMPHVLYLVGLFIVSFLILLVAMKLLAVLAGMGKEKNPSIWAVVLGIPRAIVLIGFVCLVLQGVGNTTLEKHMKASQLSPVYMKAVIKTYQLSYKVLLQKWFSGEAQIEALIKGEI